MNETFCVAQDAYQSSGPYSVNALCFGVDSNDLENKTFGKKLQCATDGEQLYEQILNATGCFDSGTKKFQGLKDLISWSKYTVSLCGIKDERAFPQSK